MSLLRTLSEHAERLGYPKNGVRVTIRHRKKEGKLTGVGLQGSVNLIQICDLVEPMIERMPPPNTAYERKRLEMDVVLVRRLSLFCGLLKEVLLPPQFNIILSLNGVDIKPSAMRVTMPNGAEEFLEGKLDSPALALPEGHPDYQLDDLMEASRRFAVRLEEDVGNVSGFL